MMLKIKVISLLTVAAMLPVAATGCSKAVNMETRTCWVDVVQGEPVSPEELIDDLAKVDVIYLGERHTIDRHHELQQWIIDELSQRGKKLVVGLEQIENFNQTDLDRYVNGELTIEQLSEKINWKSRWSNCEDYYPLLETTRKHGGKILALNARAETIRQIARKGFESLDNSQRSELPEKINFDDPAYAEHLNSVMSVMAAAMPQRMKTMIHAQISRDETMAESVCRFLTRPENNEYTATVICGSGHVNYGFGTASRIRQRMPNLKDRIVVLSSSGELEISAKTKSMSKEVESDREKQGQNPQRISDYLHIVVNPKR